MSNSFDFLNNPEEDIYTNTCNIIISQRKQLMLQAEIRKELEKLLDFSEDKLEIVKNILNKKKIAYDDLYNLETYVLGIDDKIFTSYFYDIFEKYMYLLKFLES